VDTEELRAIIWDDLFRAKAAKSLHEIGLLTNQEPSAVRAAVEHDWFMVTGERVSIAMAPPVSDDHRQLLR
jgi:hypothetical protein